MENTLKQLKIKAAECKQLKEENLEKIKQLEREAAEWDEACDYYSNKVEEEAARCGPWLEWFRKGREDLDLPNAPLDSTESLAEQVNKTMQVARQHPAPTTTPVGQMMADVASSSAAECVFGRNSANRDGLCSDPV
jgi:hypothetical protein